MLHLATIGSGLREFILMYDRNSGKVYIEEIVLTSVDFSNDVWCHFKFIHDDNLANDLAFFCEEHNLRDMKKISERIVDMGKPEWLRPPRQL